MRNLLLLLLTATAFNTSATTWLVGPSQTYTMPSQVSTLVQNGDTVLIEAGLYAGDVAKWTADDLVLKGTGGMAQLFSNGLVHSGKGIWLIQGDNALVENIEFAEAACVDENGAGIRQEGTNLTVRHCYFHDNENGILCGVDPNSDILIEYSEFYNNGFGDGYSHNLYIGHINSLTFQHNYTHHTDVGHELKSRAANNYILYNRFGEEATGTASRSIDLPNGGLAIILGNVIEQGPNSQNSNIIGYGMEGTTNTSDTAMYVINNTIVNNKTTGSFIQVPNGTDYCSVKNNIFAGPGTVLSGTVTTLDSGGNYTGTIASVGFVNAMGYDYHLVGLSPARDMAIAPGMAGTFSLTPMYEYVSFTQDSMRITYGPLDAGAYEFFIETSVKEIGVLSGFAVYPNPSMGAFNVLISDAEIKTLSLYDNTGRFVATKSVTTGINKVDISGIAAGIYRLQASSGVGLRVVVR